MKKSLFIVLLMALTVIVLSCSKTEKNNSVESSGEIQEIKKTENNSAEKQNIEAEEVDEYTIYVDEEYYGTYLPVQSVYEIEKHKNFEKAKYGIPRECHTLLGLGRENRCYADVRFHDGYAIQKKDFDKFKFEYRGNDLYLIDNKGYEYKRISNEVNIYVAIEEYVIEQLGSCIKDLRNVEMNKNSISIDGKYHSLMLDSNFINTNGALALMNGALRTEGMSGGLYCLSDEAHYRGSFVSDEEFIHFPLLSYEPLIPLEEMSARELRLYRNLQFARHGYKFKSPDLQETFSHFKWYEPKSSNSGIKLTKEEQAIVDKCLELEKQKEIPLPKNNIIDVSEEEKKNYMVGVWYDRVPGKVNPYGYVFFPDGSFQYKDTVTDKEDKGGDKGFLSCKGTWKIKDNNIYVKVDEFKEKYLDNNRNEKIGNTTLSSAYIKIGELYNYETDDNKKPYKVDLYPILSCYVQKDNLRPFYYSKEDSDNITNLDFYNVEKNTSGMEWNYKDYLASFFEEDEYKVESFTEYEETLFIAKSFINEKKNIAKKSVIYLLNDEFIDVLLTFDKGYISDGNNILYETPDKNNSYWDINITHHNFIEAPFVTVKVLSHSNKSVIETKGFEFNGMNDFVLCASDKNGKPISNYEPVKNPITSKVIPLPLGTDGPHGKDVQYVLFGDWPQSVKNKYVTVNDEVEKVNGFDAYKGSDGYYYVKANSASIDIDRFSTGEIPKRNTDYYFKLEPIKWRVLDDNYQGGKLLFSEIAIDTVIFKDPAAKSKENEDIVLADYKNSKVRAYLNSFDGTSYNEEDFSASGFLNRAFCTEAKNLLKTVVVDNSKESQIDGLNKVKKLNKYYCEDTQDKVFIFSTKEITREEWGFNKDFEAKDNNRKIKVTDYAAIMGVDCSWGGISVEYFIRSPFVTAGWEEFQDSTVNNVTSLGTLGDGLLTWEKNIGMVPAIVVDF